MRTIFAEYNPQRNSIDVYTSAGYMLRIDCWEAEKNLKTTPGSDCALNALAIDEPLEYVRLYLNGNMQMWVDADCFVMPSYREGFPNTVMEAGAMGLPSIVTAINGSREIIIEGKNGLIVPPRTTEPLYDAMRRMLVDDVARNTMAQNARKMINSRFEKSFVQGCIINYYKEILK